MPPTESIIQSINSVAPATILVVYEKNVLVMAHSGLEAHNLWNARQGLNHLAIESPVNYTHEQPLTNNV
uniref:Uncharacterized protein n=1 Tax=Arion vulgaris TaxID=1028688 RepID=A0A0B7BNI3_9EUPU